MAKTTSGKEKHSHSSEMRRRRRHYRMIGLAAGLFTIAAVAGAGYLGVSYWIKYSASDHTAKSLPETSAVSTEAVVTTENFVPDITEPQTISEAKTEEIETTEKTSAETSEQQTQSQPEETTPDAAEKETSLVNEEEDLARRYEAQEKFSNLGMVVKVQYFLNMRQEPNGDSEVIGRIFPYCAVDILDHTDDGWYYIESGGHTGYVSDEYVVDGETARQLALDSCRYQARILDDRVMLREEPSETSAEMTAVVKNDYFDVMSEKDGWVEIEIAADQGGYLPASSCEVGYRLEEAIVWGYDGISQVRRDIINKAFEYFGGKYVFGGESLTDGIDCSAFTQQIYGMFGITIQRNSYYQCVEGTAVEEADIRPGDLLFYYGRIPGQVGHVAIYIGNGKIIHAASESKGICVSDWKFCPIVCIRNVIGD